MYLKKKSFYEKIVYNILLLLIITITSCNDSTECSDCGEVIDGFLFKKVTQDDFVNFSTIDNIEVDACMRYKIIDTEEINEKSISIVDNCCCN